MEVKQIAELINTTTHELIGLENVINEDLSNVVDAGKAIFDNTSYDNYVRSLVDHIGRVIFVDRKYTGNTLAILRDGWEYGAVLEKISAGLPEAVENESWQLTDGASYDPNVFTKPEVQAKFFDKRETFEIPLSVTDKQVKSAFSSPTQLNAFISMLWGMVDKSMECKLEALASRIVNSFIGATFAHEFPSVSDNNYSNSTSTRAINLLKLYNTQFNLTGADALTKDNCLFNTEFIKFASRLITLTMKRMKKMTTLFNIGGEPRFTPEEYNHLVLLSDFKTSADVYLQADTFHDEYTRLPKAVDTPFWQGCGTDFSLSSVANVHVTVPVEGGTKEINVSHILGVAFDNDACMLSNLDMRTTSNYNAKAEFTNYWKKCDCGMIRDENEQFVVFFVA